MSLDPAVCLVSSEEVKGDAKILYENFLQSGKQVPKWMQVMANCEDILVGFFAMFRATMDNAPLPSLLKWKVANQVSMLNKCEFCVDVTNTHLRQFGLDDDAIAHISETEDERERVALEFAAIVTEKAYAVPEELMTRVKKHFTDEELVELTAVIGLFNYINRFNDALRVLPE